MTTRRVLLAGGAAIALACGGGEPQTNVPASDASARTQPAEASSPASAQSGNRPPVIDSLGLDPEQPRSGEQVTARVSASDPDGDGVDLEYRWTVGGRPVDAFGPFLEVADVARGTRIEVTVVARDGGGQSQPATATAEVANHPPRVDGIEFEPSDELSADVNLRATPSATDLDGDAIEYRYRWIVDGREIAGGDSILVSDNYERGDEIELEVVASDGTEEGEPLRSEPIRVGNAPPRITSSPGAIGADGVFRYDVRAEDPDGDSAFSYRLATAPAGMTIGHDGALVWRPGPDQEGSYPVEVEVSDLFGGRSSQSFELRLSYAAADPPAAPGGADEEAEASEQE